MYYGEFARITRMEKLLERLAYISVGFDFLVAMATFLVTKGLPYSSFMLMLSGYLVMVELVLAAVLFSALIAIKHYRRIIDSIALSTFRNRSPVSRYAARSVGLMVLLLRKFYQLFV